MSVETLLAGAPPTAPPRQFAGPQRGKVNRVTAAGDLYVTLDAFPTVEHGPVSWSRPHPPHTHTAHGHDGSSPTTSGPAFTAPLPPKGTAVLVLFAGVGIADPWVVTFDGWPA